MLTIENLNCSKFNSLTVLNPETSPLILVGNVDKFIRTRLARMLEKDGYQILEACNAKQCLEAYTLFPIDFVILDALMPDKDGFTCCRELRKLASHQKLPILMITSLNDAELVQQAYAAGATDCITDPINWQKLCPRVRQLIEPCKRSEPVEQHNSNLDRRMQLCANQDYITHLHQALELEVTLKRITHKMRNSLDEKQILQTAVQELGRALGTGCCNAALYNSEQNTSIIRYEYTSALPESQYYALDMNICAEIRERLKQGLHIEFCAISPDPILGQVAMFAYPIADEQGVVGDLLLIDSDDRVLSEWEKQLVQQVTTQCAIAIRQAQLYQIAQSRIAELEKLNHLKDEFISIVAHELRSPMTSLYLGIQTLEYTLPQARKFCGEAANCNSHCTKSIDYLQILHNECEQQITLLNDLLSLQRFEAGRELIELNTIALDDWIQQVAQPFQRRALSRQQSLKIEVSPHLPTLVSDPTILKSILVELLNNACKYTPPTETITLTVSAESTKLRLIVSNFGVEIPAEELSRIFEKFYRVPDGDSWKQGGTGLGLALVKKQISCLGGTIRVESAEQETRFIVELPLSISI